MIVETKGIIEMKKVGDTVNDIKDAQQKDDSFNESVELTDLQKARQEFKSEQDRLISYIQKGYKARVKWVKQGMYVQVIQAELAIAVSMGRLDLAKNLFERLEKLNVLKDKIEQLDYAMRFATEEVVLLPESPSEDSTQKQ